MPVSNVALGCRAPYSTARGVAMRSGALRRDVYSGALRLDVREVSLERDPSEHGALHTHHKL